MSCDLLVPRCEMHPVLWGQALGRRLGAAKIKS